MTEEVRKNLEDLRSKVLDDIVPLMEGDTFEPAQKFALLLSAARSTGEAKTLMQAYEAVKGIEDKQDKADALLEILEEIDVQLGNISTVDEPVAVEAEAEAEAAPAEAPIAESLQVEQQQP